MLIKVFVYGTLKKGFGNHILLEGSKFLGYAKTNPLFTMVSLGGFPAVIIDGETSIQGEVYEVNEEALRSLDRLEGHPNWYKRIEVVTDLCKAWMYCMHPGYVKPVNPIIESGIWSR